LRTDVVHILLLRPSFHRSTIGAGHGAPMPSSTQSSIDHALMEVCDDEKSEQLLTALASVVSVISRQPPVKNTHSLN
jgi:hypothetical protein